MNLGKEIARMRTNRNDSGYVQISRVRVVMVMIFRGFITTGNFLNI